MLMFVEEEGWIGDRWSRHSGLLWALENLAWHPDYLSRVSLILATLARLDPGGQLANRPLSSLRDLFLPWLVQTAADTERRREALDLVLDREPGTAWKLLIAIGPAYLDSASYLHQPSALWRDALLFSVRRATREEYLEAINRNTRQLLQLVGTDVARWLDLTKLFPRLSPEHREEFLSTLCARAEAGALQGGDPELLRSALRDVLDTHRSFGGKCEWALPRAETDRLEAIYSLVAPDDPVDRNRYLFETYWPNLTQGHERQDHRGHVQAIEQARDKALREMLASNGVDGIVRLAKQAGIPSLVGNAAESLGLDAESEQLLLDRALETTESWGGGFARGFLVQRTYRKGWTDAEHLLVRARAEGWDGDCLLRLLFALPEVGPALGRDRCARRPCPPAVLVRG